MHTSRFNKLKLVLGFIGFLSFGTQAAESDKQRIQDTGPVTRFMSSCGEFMCERIAGLYYTTSVTGHASTEPCISEFLKGKLQGTWDFSEFKYLKEKLPFRNDKEYAIYKTMLKDVPGCSALNLDPIQHEIVYQYLWKITENAVNIIVLQGINHAYFAPEDHKVKDVGVGIIEKRINYSKALSFLLNALTQEEGRINNELINLKYNEGPYRALLGKERENTQKLLEEKKKRITNQKEEISKKMGGLEQEWRTEDKAYQLFTSSKSFVDFSNEGFHSTSVEKLLGHLQETFPQQQMINIYTLVSSESSISRNLAGRVLSTIGNSCRSAVEHYTYGKIIIDPAKASMDVRVIDSTFNTEINSVSSYLSSFVFAPENSLPVQSLNFFTKLSQSFGLTLSHRYNYRGDQSLYNWHDCGRFSIIYLSLDLEGHDILNLSNYAIYKGFKTLQSGGYDQIHQAKSEFNRIPQVHSRFSWYITGPMRGICDFLLGYIFLNPKSTGLTNKKTQ